jgi:hypothetical protein
VATEDEDPDVARERAAKGVALTRVEFHVLDAPGSEVFYPLNVGDSVVSFPCPVLTGWLNGGSAVAPRECRSVGVRRVQP